MPNTVNEKGQNIEKKGLQTKKTGYCEQGASLLCTACSCPFSVGTDLYRLDRPVLWTLSAVDCK